MFSSVFDIFMYVNRLDLIGKLVHTVHSSATEYINVKYRNNLSDHLQSVGS